MKSILKPVWGEPQTANIRDLIANPPASSVYMQITPEIAAEMLERNDRNRPASAKVARGYAQEMAAGKWRYTRVPIIFSDAGRLIDGQHRLQAVVMSGAIIEADVAFGAPDDAFAFIDIGKKRGASDIFAINGVQDYTTVSAAMGWVHQYLNDRMRNHGAIGASAADLYELYKDHTDIHDSVKFGRKFNKARIASASMMTALHYLCAHKCRRDADHFFTVAGDGFGAESKFDPPLVLRNKLIEGDASGKKLHRVVTSGLTITAWNLSRAGRSGRGLRFDPTSTFPRVR